MLKLEKMKKLLIIQGKDLTPADLETINISRKEEFGADSKTISPKPSNEDWEKIYFLLREESTLLSYARLHDVEVTFLDKTYSILGIATTVSLQKGKGYGKKLTLGVKAYVKHSGKTALGFCNKFITPF